MFDRTTHIHKGVAEPYCREVKIEEKRAPTDESIRLLQEREEQTRKQIVERLSVAHGSDIEVAVFNHTYGGYKVTYQIKMCGEIVEHTIDYPVAVNNAHDYFEFVVGQLGKVIAGILTRKIIRERMAI